ncbi:MAG: HEAT repeat domain-containing protein [Hydrococcus sp. Prado102]|nr:HEAT repeat domain-containing protein [Hydrococcus sp. Prado102]
MNNSEIEKAHQHIIKSTDVEITVARTASSMTDSIGIGIAIASLIVAIWAICGGSIGAATRTAILFVIGGFIGAWVGVAVNSLPSRKQQFRLKFSKLFSPTSDEYVTEFVKTYLYLYKSKLNEPVEINSEVAILALSDRDPNIRSQAAIALGKARSEEAVPALCKALAEDPDPEVRRNVAEALGIIGDEEIEVKS